MQNFFSLNTVGMLDQMTKDEYWWFTVLLSMVLCVGPIYAQKAYLSFYRPRTSTLMQEYQYKHASRLGLNGRPIFCCCGKQESDPVEADIRVSEVELVDLFENPKDAEFERRVLNIRPKQEVV